MTDPLSPTPLSEEERLHFTNLREAWRRAAPVYTDLAATDVEWLCTLIDRLSSPSVDPEDFAECDHCGGPLNADRPEENSSPGVAEPPDEERCPGCSRLPRVCSHGIYHHGCPSCDRQDPEARP